MYSPRYGENKTTTANTSVKQTAKVLQFPSRKAGATRKVVAGVSKQKLAA